jgi:hypothetical protein
VVSKISPASIYLTPSCRLCLRAPPSAAPPPRGASRRDHRSRLLEPMVGFA